MKALILVLALLPVTARGEDLNLAALGDGTSVVAATTGVDHGIVIGAGYGYVATVAGRPVVLGGDVTLDVADGRDSKLRAGALAPILGADAWKLIAGAGVVVRNGHSDVAQMIDVGTDVTVLAGRYSPRWFAAAEAGFDWALATHVDHSAMYRMLVYPDARDGWYRNTGGLFRFGVQGGVTFGENDIVLRAGMLRDDAGSAPTLPFYGTLGYDRRW